jgi:hypothetical protein
MEVSGQLHAPVVFPRGKNPDIHWIGEWMDPKADLICVLGENINYKCGKMLG